MYVTAIGKLDANYNFAFVCLVDTVINIFCGSIRILCYWLLFVAIIRKHIYAPA